MLEVSAPKDLAFDAVWSSIEGWLKHRAEHDWSEENLELVQKAVSRAATISMLRIFGDDVTIVPVASEEEAEYLSDQYGPGIIFLT